MFEASPFDPRQPELLVDDRACVRRSEDETTEAATVLGAPATSAVSR